MGDVLGTSPRVAIVIPTLGNRSKYLEECIRSVKDSQGTYLVVISPDSLILDPELAKLVDQFLLEEGVGLATAINQAAFSLPPTIEYFNWLGDDDLLAFNSTEISMGIFDDNPGASGVYGMCEYINSKGSRLGVNSSGTWAKTLIRFGPDLIPSPGSLLSLDAFKQIGGLRTEYNLAFDVDLFIRLQKSGPLIYVPKLLGKFRWHEDSLTVRSRLVSAREASRIRRQCLPQFARFFSIVWEFPIVVLTYLAGVLVGIRNQRLS
jgi:glycosyltransferase involved in cell wall biosynthesis